MAHELSGVVVIDKPSGPTSFDVVRRVKALFKTRRCGHTGTLDPTATGVLPICIGDATKIASFVSVRPNQSFHTVSVDRGGVVRLAELPNIAMVKEATGSLDQASQIIGATNLTVLSGDDSLTIPLMAIGGRGVISVVGNIVPKDMLALVSAMLKGNLADAQKWHRKLFPLCRDMLGLSTNPIPIKAAMKLLGRDTGQLRLPMTPLESAGEAKLRKTLSAYGLL